jgi:hypothetical protein
MHTRRELEQRMTRVGIPTVKLAEKKPTIHKSVPKRQRKDTFDVQAMVNAAIQKLSQIQLEVVAEDAKKQEAIAKEAEKAAMQARESEERLAKQAEAALVAKQASDDQAAHEKAQAAIVVQEKAQAAQAAQENAQVAQTAQAAQTAQLQALKEEIPESVVGEATRLANILAVAKSHRTAVHNNQQLQTWCDEKKMRLRALIGQLTNGRSHIVNIAKEVMEILNMAKRKDALAYEWIQDFLAKQVAKQAETEVSVSPAMAFPLARIVQKVTTEHADFADFLMGRLCKKCIHLVPKYCNQISGESELDYKLRIKQTRDEGETVYEERMCGMVSLFAAMIQPLPGMRQNSDWGIGMGWTWLARLLNMKPRKITPQLIHAFLTIAGHQFIQKYNLQGKKMMKFLRVYNTTMPADAISGSTRLSLLLDTFEQTGQFEEPVAKKWDIHS